MEDKYHLQRFSSAQDAFYNGYAAALEQIRNGYKSGHWIWYIFPQLKGLGKSDPATFYGISGLEEAKAYANNPMLGSRLTEICQVLLELPGRDIRHIMGDSSIDAQKLRSSMTLFEAAVPENPVFSQVLDRFFDGKRDNRTLGMLKKQ